VQLPSYNYAKRVLTANGYTAENSYWTYLASSSFSGICVVSRLLGRTERGGLMLVFVARRVVPCHAVSPSFDLGKNELIRNSSQTSGYSQFLVTVVFTAS
jgi:hypothetical protein